MVNSNLDECPYCHFKMKKGMAPFLFHGSYLGQFEAYICDFCHRNFFTEKAYREIMMVPTSLDDFTSFVDQENQNSSISKEPLLTLLEPSDSSVNEVFTNNSGKKFFTNKEEISV
jgi:hypothetical protein